MKKILVLLFVAILLVGCSSANDEANLTTHNEVIYQSADKSYTENDLNKAMKVNDYTTVAISEIFKIIGEKENVDFTKIEQQASEGYDNLAAMGYESYLISIYGSKEKYIEQAIGGEVITELLNKEAENMFADSVKEHEPYKAQVAYFGSKDLAQAVIDAVNNEENTFAYAASENGYSSSVNETIYTDEADLPIEVKEAIQKQTEMGLSQIVLTSTSATDSNGNSTITERYYVVNLISKDANEFKDEFITYIVNNYLDDVEITNKYLAKYDVKCYDQTTYKYLTDNGYVVGVK